MVEGFQKLKQLRMRLFERRGHQKIDRALPLSRRVSSWLIGFYWKRIRNSPSYPPSQTSYRLSWMVRSKHRKPRSTRVLLSLLWRGSHRQQCSTLSRSSFRLCSMVRQACSIQHPGCNIRLSPCSRPALPSTMRFLRGRRRMRPGLCRTHSCIRSTSEKKLEQEL